MCWKTKILSYVLVYLMSSSIHYKYLINFIAGLAFETIKPIELFKKHLCNITSSRI